MPYKLDSIIQDLRLSFMEYAVQADAHYMEKYMHNQYSFYGVKAPKRNFIFRELKPLIKEMDKSELLDFVKACWEEDKREFQHLAGDVLKYKIKEFAPEDLPFLETLVLRKSWWDTVDFLATHPIGAILKKDRHFRRRKLREYAFSEKLWLIRTALIAQLFYKNDTDHELLSEIILKHKNSEEFFIQKGSGWALRQYSKINPEWVKLFLDENPTLKRLTIREASNYL